MNEEIYKTLKSAETEDWLDYHVIRPFSYYWAKAFNKFDIHPNTVTIASMFVGAACCLLFVHGCYYYEGVSGLLCNLAGIVLLMVADILDCADGQLARMSGKKSRIGRILDGLAGFTWFTPIYVCMVWRFYNHHSLEFGWLGISDTPQNVIIATIVVFIIGLMSGILGIAAQQRLADYYIQVHLFFLKGEAGSELDNSEQQQEIYEKMDASASGLERWFQKSYVDYTKKQEKVTPQFQKLMKLVRKFGGVSQMPQDVREDIHQSSLRLMPWNGLLTFNFRSFWLFVFCLIDLPVEYFLFELIAMGLLTEYIRRRHEAFCQKAVERIEKEKNI
jgi:phosphatidylglycerophosphate synthase